MAQSQREVLSLVLLNLKSVVYKKILEQEEVLALFEALQKKYHHKETMNRLFATYNL